MANVLNYTEQGGAKTVIGGTLEVAASGKLDLKSGATLAGLPKAANVAAVDTASPTADKNAAGINAVIAALIAAGLRESAS